MADEKTENCIVVIWRENLIASETANFHQPLCFGEKIKYLNEYEQLKPKRQIIAG